MQRDMSLHIAERSLPFGAMRTVHLEGEDLSLDKLVDVQLLDVRYVFAALGTGRCASGDFV